MEEEGEEGEEEDEEVEGKEEVKEEDEKDVVTCKCFQLSILLAGDDCGFNQNRGSKPHIRGNLHQLLPLQGPRKTLTCVYHMPRSCFDYVIEVLLQLSKCSILSP